MKNKYFNTKKNIETLIPQKEIIHKIIGVGVIFFLIGFTIGHYSARFKYSASLSEISKKYNNEKNKVCREDFYYNKSINAARQNYKLNKENIELSEKLTHIKKQRDSLQKKNRILLSLKNLKEESPVIKRDALSKSTLESEIKKNIKSNSARRYVSNHYVLAMQEQEKFGIPASVTLAQGIVESASGTSSLARNQNNHFGIKYYRRNYPSRIKKWDGLVDVNSIVKRPDDDPDDKFIAFKGVWHCYRYHSYFLAGEGSPYLKYVDDKSSYEDWIYALVKIGYATDKKYGYKIKNIIEKYKLYIFDNQSL